VKILIELLWMTSLVAIVIAVGAAIGATGLALVLS
jgi:hypothetical protein